MRGTMISHQARRHPFAVGMFLLVLSPYILAATLLAVTVAVAFVVLATVVDALGGRR